MTFKKRVAGWLQWLLPGLGVKRWALVAALGILLFVGQNRDVSRLAGIRVDRIRLGAFVATGFLSALAGVILAGTLGAFQSSVAPTYLLPAFGARRLEDISPSEIEHWRSQLTGVGGAHSKRPASPASLFPSATRRH